MSSNPLSINGFQIDYYMDAENIFGSDGDPVSMTGSFTTHANFAPPTLKRFAVNGNNSLSFSGNQALLAVAPPVVPNPNQSGGAFPIGFSAFAVIKPDTLTNLGPSYPNDRRTFIGFRSTVGTAGDDAWSISQSGKIFPNLQHEMNSGHWGSYGAPGIGTFSTGHWHVVGIRTDGETLTCWKGLSFDKSDVNAHFGAGYTQFVNGFCLGADMARPGARNWTGEIAYFALINRAITDQEYVDAAGFLLNRFNLPLREIGVSARVGTTGKDLFVSLHAASTGKPAHVHQSAAVGPIGYRVNGGPLIQSVPMARKWGDNGEYSNLLSVPLASPVTGSDVVTLTIAPAQILTILGPCEELTNAAVTNYAGQASMLSQEPPANRTMKLGWNYNNQGSYFTTLLGYRNLFKTATLLGESSLTRDASGNVVNAPEGTVYLLRTGSEDPTTGPGLNGDYPGVEYGRYVVQWDGPSGSLLELSAYSLDFGQTTIAHVAGMDDLAGTTKRRYFDVTPSETMTRHRPTFNLRHASAGHTCTNIVVMLARYEGTSGHFADQVVDHMTGADSIRFMDTIPTNFSNIGNIAELTPITDATYARIKTRSIPITRIESYEGTHYSGDSNIQHWKITFGEPHNLTDGQGFTIFSTDDNPIPVTLTSGVVDLRNAGAGGNVLSATEFYLALYYGGGTTHSATVTPFTGSNAIGKLEVVGGMPVEMLAHLTNEADANACHVCVPHPASDACASRMADVLAATLDAGRKVRVETSNEPWNLGFSQWGHWRNEGAKRGLVPLPPQSTAEGYIARAVEVFDIFKARWVAASRSADDVEFVVNSWNVDVTYTTRMATWLAAHRPEVHCRWCLAPYFNAVALGRLPGVDYSTWTLERMMDYLEAWVLTFNICEYVSEHKAELDRLGISHTLATYENQNAYLGFSPPVEFEGATVHQRWTNWNRECLAAYYHPRMRGITFHQMKVAESEGLVDFVVYGYNANFAYEVPSLGFSIYGDFLGLTTAAGRGDGSDGFTDNRPYLIDAQGKPAWVPHLNLTSPRAGARMAWKSGVTTPPSLVLSATIGPVFPDPRTSSVDTLSITFSEAVTGFDLGDLFLWRSGAFVPLTGAILSGGGASYTLSGLAPMTAEPGFYRLAIFEPGSGIVGATGLRLVSNVYKSWTVYSPGVSGVPNRGKSGRNPSRLKQIEPLRRF